MSLSPAVTHRTPSASPDAYGVLLVSFSKHSHQRNFVPLYLRHPNIRVVAVTDEVDIPPQQRALNMQWANDLDVPYVEGVEQGLELEGVDIVSIGCEIERRAGVAALAALAGKHLWIDKFLGATVDECDTVVAAVANAGVSAVIPSYAYGELVRRSREVLVDGQLGELLGIHVDIMFSKGWPRPIPDRDRDRPFLPPGRWKFPDIKRELLTVGAYAVGLIQSCCGPIRQVYGHAGAFFFPEHAAHGAEDFGTLTLVDDSGCTASLCAGRIGVATDAMGGPSRAWLVGTEGTAVVDVRQPAVNAMIRSQIVETDYTPAADDPMQWASGPPLMGSPIRPDGGLAEGLEDLVRAIDEGRSPHYSVQQARDNMEILIAGYRSIVEGAPVSLPHSV